MKSSVIPSNDKDLICLILNIPWTCPNGSAWITPVFRTRLSYQARVSEFFLAIGFSFRPGLFNVL